jgi:hypothetical protein
MPIAGKPRVSRVQRQIRRAFIAHNGKPLTVADLLPDCFPWATQYVRSQRWSAHRNLPNPWAVSHAAKLL